ncbi:hypothetical protein PGB90_001055 [Kerria lacca]
MTSKGRRGKSFIVVVNSRVYIRYECSRLNYEIYRHYQAEHGYASTRPVLNNDLKQDMKRPKTKKSLGTNSYYFRRII